MSTQTPTRADATDAAAAKMAGEGLSLAQIAARFDPPLSIEQANGAVKRGRHQMTARSVPPPSQPAPDPQPDQLEQLLAWAENDGPQRAATLAARTRTQLDELRELREAERQVAPARRKIVAAEKALADAKAELRRITISVGSPMPKGSHPLGVPSKTIREWARAAGVEVASTGRVRKPVLALYAAAHPETGAAS